MSENILIEVLSSVDLSNKVRVKNKQIETRGFQLAVNRSIIEGLKGEGNQFKAYKKQLIALLDQERIYYSIGNSEYVTYDNLFDLEILGIGKYAKKYTCVIDLKDRLDFVLHVLTGCDMDNINSIPDYTRISRALLTKDFNDVDDIRVGDFLDVDPNLDRYLVELEESLFTEDEREEFSEEKLYKYLRTFYSNVLEKLNDIKSYIIAYLKENESKYSSLVYRSKSLSGVLGTSDIPISEKIFITYQGCDPIEVEVNNYLMMDYAYKRGAV